MRVLPYRSIAVKAYAVGFSQLDLKDASDDALKRLSDACVPAHFGRDDESVLDESYRKAGVLSNDEFAVKLDVEESGLMSLIRNELLEGWAAQKTIKAELYKLNVYGTSILFFAKCAD